jgi:predicted nucleic acid-binding Zn ribbon protein
MLERCVPYQDSTISVTLHCTHCTAYIPTGDMLCTTRFGILHYTSHTRVTDVYTTLRYGYAGTTTSTDIKPRDVTIQRGTSITRNGYMFQISTYPPFQYMCCVSGYYRNQ